MTSFSRSRTQTMLRFLFISLAIITLIRPTTSNVLTVTCLPEPCNTTLTPTSEIILLATYTQNDTNIVPLNISFSYTYRDQGGATVPVDQPSIPWHMQFPNAKTVQSTFLMKDFNVQAANGSAIVNTTVTYSEITLHDGNLVNAGTMLGPGFTVLGIPQVAPAANASSPASASGTVRPTSTSGKPGAATTSPKANDVLVLGSSAVSSMLGSMSWMALCAGAVGLVML